MIVLSPINILAKTQSLLLSCSNLSSVGEQELVLFSLHLLSDYGVLYSHCIILKTTLLLKCWILLGSRCNPTGDKDEHQILEQLRCGIWSLAGERRLAQVVMRRRYLSSLLFSVDRHVIIVSRSDVRETSLSTFRHLTGTPAIVFSQRSSSAPLSA